MKHALIIMNVKHVWKDILYLISMNVPAMDFIANFQWYAVTINAFIVMKLYNPVVSVL